MFATISMKKNGVNEANSEHNHAIVFQKPLNYSLVVWGRTGHWFNFHFYLGIGGFGGGQPNITGLEKYVQEEFSKGVSSGHLINILED
jgi:hypothetical protein